MASFSTKSNPFLIDSIFSPHKISGFVEEIENLNFNWVYSDNNEPSGSVFKEQNSTGEFTAVGDIVALTSKKRRAENGVKDEREGKPKKQKKGTDEKKVYKGSKKDRKKDGEEPPNGYIHVRARRGQATDSHSLAERVRRQKISERMEKLKRLVPGCDKITGKTLILDEIINYVQSLESQVEFLSVKLASLNPMLCDLGVDLEAIMVKPEMVNNISSPPLPPPQCNPTRPITTTAASATFTPTSNIPLLDTSASLLLHQEETPAVFSQFQDNGNLLWEMEGLRQEFFNFQDNGNLLWEMEGLRQEFLNPFRSF